MRTNKQKEKERSVFCLENKTNLKRRTQIKTFIPARERTLLSLNWPDWTGVVYMSASLN